ncbi:MAG: glucose/mannose-6-phosphate isomerase [Blastocatellia bacterium]|jgi:glucose/mannose-6-phosphate isomerase|nr:glucose/mannose-6-phosphate isomerase [Blastocatellia bacterium]
MDEFESKEAMLSERAERLDKSNMAKVIENTPRQIENALAQELPPAPEGPFDEVIIAGMGGSALPAEVVINSFTDALKIPIKVIRRYTLPKVDEKSLVIVCSFSGNTEETLSVIEGFPAAAANVVVVTAGGRLADVAAEKSFPLIKIPVWHEPEGFQPRSAVGYFATYFVRLLEAVNALSGALAQLAEVPSFLRGLAGVRSEAEDFAMWLENRIPVVYTDELHLTSIARIAKIKFNENAKRPAFFNALPEANHNEMIGFTRKGLAQFGLLYLHDPASHPRIRERYLVMKKVFMEDGLDHVDFREWEIPGQTKIQKTFAAVMLADWCSYTLALLDGFDPSPVPLVEKFKGVLSSSSNTG